MRQANVVASEELESCSVSAEPLFCEVSHALQDLGDLLVIDHLFVSLFLEQP